MKRLSKIEVEVLLAAIEALPSLPMESFTDQELEAIIWYYQYPKEPHELTDADLQAIIAEHADSVKR